MRTGRVRARVRAGRRNAARKWFARALFAGCIGWGADAGWAQNPTGGNVVAGSASIATAGTTLNVNAASQRTVIDWQSFSIGQGHTANFHLPNANAAVLNRVVTPNNPSTIYGSLNSNGHVFLVNPSGVLVGPSGAIQTNGFTASTFDLLNDEFMAGGAVNFRNNGSTASIVNQGSIATGSGGATLIANQVLNEGTIRSVGGNITLARGGTVTLANGTTYVQADLATVANGVSETAGLIRNSGVVRATGAAIQGGEVYLVNPNGKVLNSGTLVAQKDNGNRGGQVTVESREIEIASGAKIDASGKSAGGEVLIGGDWQGSGSLRQATTVTLAAGATIDASATERGDGGTIVLWTDVLDPASRTIVHGTLLAHGGEFGGDGGRIETSGHWLDVDGIVANASAPLGVGGVWLLDPYDLTVTEDSTTAGTSSGPPYTFTSGASATNVKNTDIETQLNGGTSVVLQTSSDGSDAGDITVSANITKSAGGDASLTLKAHNSIVISSATIDSTSGKLNVTLNSDSDGSGGGAINLSAATINSNGGGIVFGGGADPTTTASKGAGTYNHGIELKSSSIVSKGGEVSLRGTGLEGASSFAVGVRLENSTVDTSSSSPGVVGATTIVGTGGSDGTAGFNYGVHLNGSSIKASGGDVVVQGNGGTGSHGGQRGVVFNGGGRIAVTGATNVTVTGVGGSSDGSANAGINIFGGGTPASGIHADTGTITVTATAGTVTGLINRGLYIDGGGQISGNGPILITGAGGTSGPFGTDGIYLGNGTITTNSSNQNITLTTDSLYIGSSGVINAGTGTVTIQNRTTGTLLDLGGADVLTESLQLGLSAAELAQITAGTLQFQAGSVASGNLTVSSDVNVTSVKHLYLASSEDIIFKASVSLGQNGGALVAIAGGTLTLGESTTLTSRGDLTLVGGRIVNNAGANPLIAGDPLAWAIWSNNPSPFDGDTPDDFGDLEYDSVAYDMVYGEDIVLNVDRWLYFAIQPTLTIDLVAPIEKLYDGTTLATLTEANFSFSGLIHDDRILELPLIGEYDTPEIGNGKSVATTDWEWQFRDHNDKPVFGYRLNYGAHHVGRIYNEAGRDGEMPPSGNLTRDLFTRNLLNGDSNTGPAPSGPTYQTRDVSPPSNFDPFQTNVTREVVLPELHLQNRGN